MSRGISRESFWRRMIRGQAQSGLSIRSWCRRHRLAEPTFYAWRKRLAGATSAEAAFVPVQVVNESPGAGVVEIILAGRQSIRVTGPVNRQALDDVLAVMEARSC